MNVSTLRAAAVAQLIAAGLAILLLRLLHPPLLAAPLAIAITQGSLAAAISRLLRAPAWWMFIHLGFMPLVVLASSADVAPGWYLAAFLLLLAIFWRADRSRVPLYLTNRKTADAVARLLPAGPCRVIDLGCGTGGLLRQLARRRPDCSCRGIEHAPLPWLWARLAARNLANCRIERGDFWPVPLAGIDVVYAFLSPVPMASLWAKALNEMSPGTLLISNSFPVPGIAPERIVEVDDRRATRLYCYRPAAGPDAA